MKPQKESIINLLSGKVTFTNEPLWYRLTVILVMAAFVLGMAYLLRQWAITAFAAKGISGISLPNILKSIKGKGP